MNMEKLEDIKETAIQLDTIYSQSPTDYAYLKGWINCLTRKSLNLSRNMSETAPISMHGKVKKQTKGSK